MILEIFYSYKEDKHSKLINSWTYYFTETKNLKKGISEAKKHFKVFARENGWTRKTKLIDIQPIRSL